MSIDSFDHPFDRTDVSVLGAKIGKQCDYLLSHLSIKKDNRSRVKVLAIENYGKQIRSAHTITLPLAPLIKVWAALFTAREEENYQCSLSLRGRGLG